MEQALTPGSANLIGDTQLLSLGALIEQKSHREKTCLMEK